MASKLTAVPDGPAVIPDSERNPTVACTAAEDRCRQEYKLSSDLAYQVQRFGVGIHPVYGEMDMEAQDLTRAFEILEESRTAWLNLPQVVRARYTNWQAVEAAHRSGELAQVLQAAGVEGGGSPSAPAASPSVSAADDAKKA